MRPGNLRCGLQITCNWLSELTLYVAAVGTAWSLLGPPRYGQAAFYLFQKHLLCWQYIRYCRHCGGVHSDSKCLVIIAQCFSSYRLASSPRANNWTIVCPLLYNSQAIHRRHLSSDVLNCGVRSVELEALYCGITEHRGFVQCYRLLVG